MAEHASRNGEAANAFDRWFTASVHWLRGLEISKDNAWIIFQDGWTARERAARSERLDTTEQPLQSTAGMDDSVRGILQAIRLNPGVTFDKVREHCRLRGDDLSLWPEWALNSTRYVTESSAASLIYWVMENTRGFAKLAANHETAKP